MNQFMGNINEAAVFFGSLLFIAAGVVKLWRAQQRAVIKAHEASKVMDRVAAEFKKNSGKSMKDAIDRLELGLNDQMRQIELHREQVADLHKSQVELIRRVDDSYRLFAQALTHQPLPEEE